MRESLPARDLDELLGLSPDPWAALDGARVFLTGATGLVGRWLVESLLWAVERRGLKTRIVLLVRRPGSWEALSPHWAGHPAVGVHPGDVRDFAWPDGAFSHVVHLAAPADGRVHRADPRGLFDVIVGGTRRTLEFAERAGAGRYLLASSGAAYGRHAKAAAWVDEDCLEGPDPLDARHPYDEAKRAAETLTAIFHRPGALEPVVARLFSVVGPLLPLDWHYAAGNFVRDALAGGPIRVAGDGTPERAYLHLADMAWWFWVLLASGRGGRAYNVSGDEAVDIRGLAERIARCFDPAPMVTVACPPRPGAPVNRQAGATARARGELGLRVRIGLDEALRRTVAWHRARRDAASDGP